jgi:all-trans-8'-apo-beta-carotenal 15,15'-oxygenase
MNRRSFLTQSAAIATASMVSVAANAEPLTTAQAFAQARASNPKLAGFANAPGEFDIPRVHTEGRWPEALTGVFYRNGPALHEMAGERYNHWFDGDGLVHRWQIDGGNVGYRGRFVQSEKRKAEQAAGRLLFPAGGGGISSDVRMTGPDSINVANTSILPMGDQVWALWEGGSATALDSTTLATLGLVTLSEPLKGAPFSAHPRRGQDGRVWNIGAMGNRIALYRLARDGALEAVRVHPIPAVGVVHDFLLTERSMVVVLPSTRQSAAGDGFFAQVRGRPDLPMLVKVYDCETLELTREAELPAGFVFHFGNAWEEANGTIRFDMVYGTDCDELQAFRKVMRGDMPKTQSSSRTIVLPKAGSPTITAVRAGIEFPRINPLRAAIRNRYVFAAAHRVPGRSDWFDSVVKLDMETGRHSFANYGPDWLVEEHVFVPHTGSTAEDDGWLVGTALNWKRQQTALSVFDAKHLDRGPLARAWLDVAMPLGFHGQFVGR